ncbi:MAG: ParB/RepB/Spo0J family partition protein [Patescibacteria group bacterium]|nr:ParB/RepB/Spo0J family partition protein [Patescibacteria group bacterium]
MASSNALGRGLSALIPDSIKKDLKQKKHPSKHQPGEQKSVIELEIKKISPNANQPRRKFNKENLESLAESIKEYGVLQPILVIKKGREEYEIIAGERRYRAAKIINLERIPAIIKQSDQQNQLELAIIENIQRENLNPIEEARAYQKLMQEFSLTQEEISRKVKKGRSSIANLMRFLTLPQEIQDGLMEGKINEGHAKVIAALDNPQAQLALYKQTLKDSLTVRNIEEIAQEVSVRPHKRRITNQTNNPITSQREKIISDAVGLKVKIKPKKKGGKIIIDYYGENDLDRFIQLINQN